MFILIDESGTFRVATTRRVSCIAALIVPESFAVTLFRRFRKLIRPWRHGGEELKGSQLDEKQMAAVLALLKRFDVLVIAACVDMGLHTDTGIETHKNGQADLLRKLPPQAHPGLRRDVENLSARTRALSNQLYTQAMVLTEVVNTVFHRSTLYYAQRIPSTLGAFKWRVDAKGTALTTYEKLWMDLVLPFMQTMSLNNPLIQLEGADYSAFSRFEKTLPQPPEHLRARLPECSSPFHYTDVREVVTDDLRFSRSDRYTGLQIVDMVVSAITRACNGTLQRRGWEGVGRLMVQAEREKQTLRFLALQPPPPAREGARYLDVVNSCDEHCKRMLTRG